MNEQEMIRLAISGDASAFECLMREHENKMYAVALRMCGNREDALDCSQEAMLRIYRSLSRFKGESSFSTWVYRITMNVCLDELRRRKTRTASSLDTMLEAGYSPVDEEDTPEKHFVRSEQRRAIEECIALLPEDMRAAVVLLDMQNFSYEEISAMLKTNIGTIKSRISRGRSKLREMLQEQKELFGKTEV